MCDRHEPLFTSPPDGDTPSVADFAEQYVQNGRLPGFCKPPVPLQVNKPATLMSGIPGLRIIRRFSYGPCGLKHILLPRMTTTMPQRIISRIKLIHGLLAVGFLTLGGHAQAQTSAHYVAGAEGIDVGTLPPPGVYLRDYNLFYGASELNNAAGVSVPGAKFDVFTYAQVPRFIWITNEKILGGNFGIDGFLPLIDETLNVNTPKGRYSSSTFGIGDLLADATISWHPQQFDFFIATGFFAPTGNSSAPPTSDVGQGFWSGLYSGGATWHIDQERTWSLSVVNRFENCSEDPNTHITPGNVYTLEWGLSKSVVKTVDVGAAGYYQQKLSSDSGPGSVAGDDRVAAVGPEVVVAFPKYELSVSFRYNYEFMAEDRAQGQLGTLSVTKRF